LPFATIFSVRGYTTVVVGDGEAATREAGNGFDLILLDVMLPKKDGFDVCRDVRQAGVTVPIVMLTARAQDTEKCSASRAAPTTT
jgi:DNA-binding response OmpR family regulator